jgi:protein-disulfide isomerase
MNRRKAAEAARRHEALRRKRLLIAGGLAIAAVAAFFLARPLVADTTGSAAGDAAAAAYTAPVRGSAAAPVTIVEYGDFQCPNCGAFARGTEGELIRRYIDTGKAKLVWKNFAWIGNESKVAAQAATCAADQGKFWEYHDYLYTHQRGENTGNLSSPNLKAFASALGLDRAPFDACLDSGRYRTVVDNDGNEVRRLGLTGTPTFVINGTRVVGAQPISVIAGLIDQKLAGR